MIKNKLIIFSVLEALLGFSADGMNSPLVPQQHDQYIKVSFQKILPSNMSLEQMACEVFNEIKPVKVRDSIYDCIASQSNNELIQLLEQERNKSNKLLQALKQEHKKSDERLAEINRLGVICNDLRIQQNRDAEQIKKLKMQLAAKDRSTETKLESATKKAPFKPLDPRLERNIKANILGILNTHHYLSGKIDSTLKYLWEMGLVAETSESKHIVSNVTFCSAKSSDGTLYTPAITMSPCLWEQMFLHVDETNIARFDDSVLRHNQ